MLVLCGQIAALALARRLGRMGARVGVWEPEPRAREGPLPLAARSRYVAHAAWGPGQGADDGAWAASLEQAAEALGGRPVLLATSDATLRLASRLRARLRGRFRLLLPPHELVEALLDKRRMHALAAAAGLAVPRTLALAGEGDLGPAARELGFPCLLKAAAGQGDEGKVVVADGDELARAYLRLARRPGAALMLQELLPGGAERVALYNAYFNAASQPVAVFTGRKLRQWPLEFGTASRSEAVAVPGLAEPLTAWLRGSGYAGPVDVGLKWDARARVYKVLDVNPRLGQNYRTYVARGRERADLGWLAYAELAGLPLPAPAGWPLAARRRQWRIDDNDWRARRDLRAQGAWGPRQWAAEQVAWRLRRGENAIWCWHDPAPWLSRLRRTPRLRAAAGRARAWGKLL